MMLLLLSLGTFFLIATLAVEFIPGMRSLMWLKDVLPLDGSRWPRVSIIIAARNEEKNIETALRSVLLQDYSEKEILVVDDRSTDATGSILDRMSQDYPSLRVLHIRELPDGWLGKNHALHHGTTQSNGEVFLFADADVVMERTSLTLAVSHFVKNKLDHLTVAPQITMCSGFLALLAGYVSTSLGIFGKPWKAKTTKERYYVGIGAFNMVRADVYKTIGTHRTIAMRPDDDIKFGKLIKKFGFKQEALIGRDMISVEWYCSLREFINGLTKNSFAAIDYNLALLIGATLPYLLITVWPFLGVCLTSGPTQILNFLIACMFILLLGYNARFFGIRPWYAVGFPVGALFLLYVLWRSCITTIANGGIEWRGTHYPLDRLKANKI